MPYGLFFFLLTVTLAFVVRATSNPSSAGGPSRIEVQGHRGARAARPENTLPAFLYALEKGVDVLELDVVVTKDGHVVVSHDPHINPEICLGADGKPPRKDAVAIRELTLEQVRAFDCGTLKHPRFPEQVPAPGARLPTLKEVFEAVKASKLPSAAKVEFNIETKIVPGEPELTPEPEAFVHAVVTVAREAGLLERIWLQSFDDRTLLAARAIAPRLRTVLLLGENHVDMVAAARAAGVKAVSPNHLWLLAEDVKRLRAAKIRVVPWTANEPKVWERLVGMGVDGIITDDPARLMDWLARRTQ